MTGFHRLVRIVCIAALVALGAPKDEHHNNLNPKHLRLALCITGQLARLELLSKIKNIMIPNAMLGSAVHMFVLLDGNDQGVKQTFWRYDYSDNIYNGHNASTLKRYLDEEVLKSVRMSPSAQQSGILNRIKTHVRIETPVQNNFTVRGRRIPVANKTGPSDFFPNVTVEIEPAAVRWQNNMRWLAGLRECTKWVQAVEYHQKWFYTTVVRLRDDTYAFAPWLLTPPEKYKNGFVSAGFGSNFGVNDRNFAVDRKFADSLFRGITEDYYFNETLDLYSWGNPERRIYKVAESKGIELRNTSICEQPLLPLRGKHNKTHWRIHSPYALQMYAACVGEPYFLRRRLTSAAAGGGQQPPFIFSLDWWTSWLRPFSFSPASESAAAKISAQHDDGGYEETPDPFALNPYMPCCKVAWLRMLKSGFARIYKITY